MNKKTIAIIAAVVVLGIAGYLVKEKISQKAAETLMEKQMEKTFGGDVDVDISKSGEKGTVTYEKGGEKATFTTEGNIPSDFPKDIKIYPGAKVQGSYTGTTVEGSGGMLGLSTNDSAEKVNNYYIENLPKDGWTIEGKSQFGESYSISASKTGRTLMVMVGIDESETTISIITGNE